VTDHDRRAPILIVFCAIVVGVAAGAELVYLLLRWLA
jgi:hypothetical protein